MIRSPDGNTDLFDIVIRILQRYRVEEFLFIIYQEFVLGVLVNLMKENGSTLKKKK